MGDSKLNIPLDRGCDRRNLFPINQKNVATSIPHPMQSIPTSQNITKSMSFTGRLVRIPKLSVRITKVMANITRKAGSSRAN